MCAEAFSLLGMGDDYEESRRRGLGGSGSSWRSWLSTFQREGGRVSGSGQGSNTNEAGGPEPGQCGGLTTVTNL